VWLPMGFRTSYRVGMGTEFGVDGARTLYEFWDGKITDKLNEELKAIKSQELINLASNEYFKAVQPKNLQAQIISPVFKDWKNGQYKIISFYAKKARGMMSAFIIKNRLTNSESLKDFDWEGYCYDAKLSKPD